MGQLGSIRIIKKPPPANVQYKAIQTEIAKQVGRVGDQHVREREKVTANFETDIKFGSNVSVTEKQVTLTVSVTNSGSSVSDGFTVGDLWKALDVTGTRPHTIVPKNANNLRFQWGGPGSYSPKTRPIARSGGPGSSSGPIVYRKRVNHPGFAPRKFSVADQQARPDMFRLVQPEINPPVIETKPLEAPVLLHPEKVDLAAVLPTKRGRKAK